MKLFRRHKKHRKEEEVQDLQINQQLLKLREQSRSMNSESAVKDIRFDDDDSDHETAKIAPVKNHRIDHKKVNYKNKSECLEYVSEQCEMITMAEKQLMETKMEYGAVTEYLTDIQKIDRIPLESKEKLMDSARRILNLTQERDRFQNREVKISDIMYKHLEKYEEIVPSEIVKMQKNEEYEQLVKKDMQSLESEKAVLEYERDKLGQKKSYIQCISIIASVLIVILFFLLALFQSKYKLDVRMPMMLTVLVGIVAVFFIFLENNKTNAAIRLNERKLNKAIGLMNKVKIKFVNNRNNLDYTYQKFRVHAAKEFSYLWEQYVKMKDENRRYQQNTELLEYYRKVLIDSLTAYDVEDAEVWLYQPLALIDGKEMVEVRHRLNNRRQKLREQIDYNNSILRESRQEIEKVVKQVPDLEYQVAKMMQEYKIRI